MDAGRLVQDMGQGFRGLGSRASTAADRGAKAAAGRLGMIVDRFFDGLVCVSTPPSRRRRPGDAARDSRDQPQRL